MQLTSRFFIALLIFWLPFLEVAGSNPPFSSYSQSSSCFPIRNDSVDYRPVSFSYQKPQAEKLNFRNFIVPSALISYGFVSRYTGLKHFDESIRDEVQRHMSTDTWVDDILWVTPFAGVYGLDLLGVKAKHNFKDRVIVTGSSVIIGVGLIELTSHITNRWRPDGSEKKSFPSTHTGLSFIGAHLLMKEYSHVSPWIGVAGYGVATLTGFLRMTNNKHWFSDVVGGAGFGILSVELSYLLLPYLSRTFTFGNKHKKEAYNSLNIAPAVSENHIGFGLQYAF